MRRIWSTIAAPIRIVLYGLLRANSQGVESGYRVGSLESGALLCGGYEAYRQLHSPAFICFEHAWFFLLALARQQEMGIVRGPVCGGLRLRDLLAPQRSSCASCDISGAFTTPNGGGGRPSR